MPGTTFSTANWTGYDEATVSNPSAALTDFTLIVDVSDLSATFKSNVQSDGADIRVTKGDDTEIPYDLIDWAYNAGSPTGIIRCKWSSTLAASGTQKVRIYAGYTGGTAVAYDANDVSGYGSDDAYAAHWKMFLPLDGDYADRTSNGNDGSAIATPSATSGQVGGAYDFDGIGAGINIDAVIGEFDASEGTMLIWINPDKTSAGLRSIFEVGDSGGLDEFIGIRETATPSIIARYRVLTNTDIVLTSSPSGLVGAWHHVTCGWDASNLYGSLDGVAKTPVSRGSDASSLDFGRVARTAQGTNDFPWEGQADEVQLHNARLSDDWIAHEHAQTNDNATFWGTWAWTAVGGGGPDYTLTAASGAFTLTGQAAALEAGRTLTAAHGTFTLTGITVTLASGRAFPSNTGTFTLTGHGSTLLRNAVVQCLNAAFTLTGNTVTLTYSGATAIIPDGVDYRAADGRPHYTVADGRPHYRAEDGRPHYRA